MDNLVDFGLHSDEVRLVKVGPEWARRFEHEYGRIASAVGAGMVDIQHIGSTAVPGILAKPILDIAAAITSFDAGFALVPKLEALGYQYRGEYGIPRRHYFVLGDPVRTHHLHILEQHSAEWLAHLRFRDHLRASPEAALRYATLKRQLIARSPENRTQYQDGKAAFIEQVQFL
jgi:GrpB-like predicted nucleotidyltransferase (UPF0157 family)